STVRLPTPKTRQEESHPAFLPVVRVQRLAPTRLKQLIASLQEESIERDRWQITGQIAGYGPEGVRQLVAALKDPATSHYRIVQALRWLGPRAAEAYPALLEALGDKRAGIQLEAIWAIHSVGKGREALPMLLSMLEAIDDDRIWAVAGDEPSLLPLGGEDVLAPGRLQVAV